MNAMSSVQGQIEQLLHQQYVSSSFFVGDPFLEGFAIVDNGTPYVVINQVLSPDRQLYVAKRELAHIQLGHLTDGQSSLFLSELQKYEAEAKVRAVQ